MRDITLLINPTSGRGRGERIGSRVATHLTIAGFTVQTMIGTDAGHSGELAEAAVKGGTDALVLVGGDGMVHLGLQAVAGRNTPLGIIPAGGGNDIARALGLPLRNPLRAADYVGAGRIRKIDLGKASGRWFGGVVAAGFDARVNERANRMRWPQGRLRYNLAMLAELGVFTAVPYELELDGQKWSTQAMLVAIGNMPYYGGGMKVVPSARPDDGLFDVMVVKPLSRAKLLTVFPRVYAGTHVRLPFVEVRQARSVRVNAPDICAYVDGERLGPLPQTFTAVPEALSVFAPPSPANREA
ncbi:diacylglycerol kinase [Natronoglycomyces albus]|nr:diacylglycerol kinase [Natronoglycomyces albus]